MLDVRGQFLHDVGDGRVDLRLLRNCNRQIQDGISS